MRRLAPSGSTVVVAVSGGPDSQALLDALARLQGELSLTLVAAGIDHGLRPQAADELDFACQLARKHQVPFEMVSVELEAGENVLAAARHARYRALRDVARAHEAERIAVAHTASDQVESILLNLARGSGLRGARGMLPRRGRIIRPMLDVSRAEVLEYIAGRGLPFATDPTNADPRRARAKLRASVVPALLELNPAMEHAFTRFARAARADESLLRQVAQQELEGRLGVLDSLAVAGIEAVPRPIFVRVLELWLAHHGLRSNQRGLAALLSICRAGRGAHAISGSSVRVEADRLWRIGEHSYDERLGLPGAVHIESLGVDIRAAVIEPSIGPTMGDEPRSVAFDCDSLHLDIRVRSWKDGDRFRPFGLDGHTKIGDLFTDRKIPRALRAVWPLVVHGDEVLWVAGLRRGSIAPVAAGTKRILTLTVEGAVPEW